MARTPASARHHPTLIETSEGTLGDGDDINVLASQSGEDAAGNTE